MTDKHKHIVMRFALLYVFIIVLFALVIYKIIVIQYVEGDKWRDLAAKQNISDVIIKPKRGNIFASDGRLLASSIPTYRVFMDMQVGTFKGEQGKQFFNEHVDSLAFALSSYFKDKSKDQYKRELTKAFKEGKRRHPLIRKDISYTEHKDLQNFPLLRLGRFSSGMYSEERLHRVKPFGSLAARTIGDVYRSEGMGGRSGLEGSFDKELEGTPGLSKQRKIANQRIRPVEVEPIHGLDLYTTIDIEIQDIAENVLRDTIGEMKAEAGCIVVMEVKTGEIKAIVNLDRDKYSGRYYEGVNHALSNQMEPGSTFKIASLIAVLDEGKVKIDDVFDIEGGRIVIGKRNMTDHNFNRGGYDKLKVNEIIQASSNVGTSKMVIKSFGNKPEKYVEKLYDMRLNDSLPLQMKGAAKSRIKHPKKNKSEWYGTTLAWMSIGYETIMPPIYTLTFYNAIANDGKMISPLFVKHIKRNESIVKTYEAQVLKESICKESTLRDVQNTLVEVIEGKYATAKSVKSDMMKIAGKTGTAQILGRQAKESSDRMRHNVSFCGYFPADNPRYSAIVVISKPEGIPSGGRMAGSIFKKMAEKIMLTESTWTAEQIVNDSAKHQNHLPQTYCGNGSSLRIIASSLNLAVTEKTGWVQQDTTSSKHLKLVDYTIPQAKVPDVTNMGAKDAFYLLSSLGLQVKLNGNGKVYAQSLKPLSDLQIGRTIELELK